MPITPHPEFVPFMTVEEVKEEVMLLNLENIKKYPIAEGKRLDFYSLWNKYGPQAGRDIMIPMIWYGMSPKPSEYFG